MRENDEPSGRSKAWIWILALVLIALLMVPFLSMGVALTKSGLSTVLGREKKAQALQSTKTPEANAQDSNDLGGLRAMLEKAAAGVVKVPQLSPKMKEVQIQAPAASITKATSESHSLLSDRHLQYVEAVDNDRIRIIVIISSKEWPELSGSLQMAAQKDGFIYHGPSQTATTGDQADSMVAEIEILKKLGD